MDIRIKQIIYKIYSECTTIDIKGLQRDKFPKATYYNNILWITFLYGQLQLTEYGMIKIGIYRHIYHCALNIENIVANILSILEPYSNFLSDHIEAEILTENINLDTNIPRNHRQQLHEHLVSNEEIRVYVFGEHNFELAQNKLYKAECRMKYTLKDKYSRTVETSGFIRIIARQIAQITSIIDVIQNTLK